MLWVRASLHTYINIVHTTLAATLLLKFRLQNSHLLLQIGHSLPKIFKLIVSKFVINRRFLKRRGMRFAATVRGAGLRLGGSGGDGLSVAGIQQCQHGFTRNLLQNVRGKTGAASAHNTCSSNSELFSLSRRNVSASAETVTAVSGAARCDLRRRNAPPSIAGA
jgi:hypothetical protein